MVYLRSLVRLSHRLCTVTTGHISRSPLLLHSVSKTNIFKSHADKLNRNFHASTAACKHVFTVQDVADFEKNVMKSDKPVIVDFHAGWCGPCKILGPRLEKIISNRKDVTMAKIDIDNSDLDEVVARYKVVAVPTVVAIVNGKATDQFTGAKDEDQIEAFIDKAAGK